MQTVKGQPWGWFRIKIVLEASYFKTVLTEYYLGDVVTTKSIQIISPHNQSFVTVPLSYLVCYSFIYVKIMLWKFFQNFWNFEFLIHLLEKIIAKNWPFKTSCVSLSSMFSLRIFMVDLIMNYSGEFSITLKSKY